MAKLGKNENVTTDVLVKICTALQCDIGDIMELTQDTMTWKGASTLAEQAVRKADSVQARPILKWAGGKTQMLGDLLPKVPNSYGRYIEPFFGDGAMFFALQPESAIIADSNPELINMYQEVANHVENVIQFLKQYESPFLRSSVL